MKKQIIAALTAFIAQRSGIDPRNYGSRETLMDDYRPMIRHGKQARTMLGQVALWDSITADDIIQASRRSYSGRLSITPRPDGSVAVDYTTGQYFAVEYRKAACRVLASVLGEYYRRAYPSDTHKALRNALGRGIVGEWFTN